MWKDLSMSQRAKVIQLAIKNGMRDLNTIRSFYDDTVGNKFPEGGDISDEQYFATMEKVAEENNPIWNKQRIAEGGKPLSVEEDLIRILNDNSYDYRGFYNKYPQTAADANSHWTDEFKTAYHPTFSDESKYSGKKSQYNPYGYRGGHWVEETFFPEIWQTADSNKFPDGGPKETYNLGYIPEVTIEAERKNNPYIYYDPWSGRYKGMGIGGQRIEYGEGFNPEGSILLPDALAYENQRLERAKQDDLNHTQAFAENIKDFVGGLVTAPMFDVAAEPIGTVISKVASKVIKPKSIMTNATKMTSKQWTAAQDAAIARGDMAEAQRLRNLHNAIKSGTVAVDEKGMPIKSYHTINEAYPADFTVFNPDIEGTHSAIYTTDSPLMSGTYTNRIVSEAEKEAYINAGIENMRQAVKEGWVKGSNLKEFKKALESPETAREYILSKNPSLRQAVSPERQKELFVRLQNPLVIEGKGKHWNNIPINELPEDVYKELKASQMNGYTTRDIEAAQKATGNYDGAIIKNITDYGGSWKSTMRKMEPSTVYQVNSPKNVKLADAVTYDDNGVRIPLGERDNFNIDDIRYSWLPWILGGGTTAVLTGVDTKATGGFLTKKSRNKVKKH